MFGALELFLCLGVNCIGDILIWLYSICFVIIYLIVFFVVGEVFVFIFLGLLIEI